HPHRTVVIFNERTRPSRTTRVVVDMIGGDPSKALVRTNIQGPISCPEQIPERTAWQGLSWHRVPLNELDAIKSKEPIARAYPYISILSLSDALRCPPQAGIT